MFCSLLTQCTIPCACHAKRHLNVQKWSECASRHNGVHFFDISTSKSAPNLVCFARFDFEMCLAPQRRANFSSLIWPDGSAPAALASPLFDPPEPQITGKHREPRLFYLFARLHLLSSDSFSSLIFFSSLTLPTSAFPSVHIVESLTSTSFGYSIIYTSRIFMFLARILEFLMMAASPDVLLSLR